jgi:hypothetical protein
MSIYLWKIHHLADFIVMIFYLGVGLKHQTEIKFFYEHIVDMYKWLSSHSKSFLKILVT